MSFTWGFKAKFADEFARLDDVQQDKVLDFTDLYEAHGLADFSRYPGKVTPSWKGLATNHPDYAFTYTNCLWHYHVGLPNYTPTIHGKYQTSDWVLHFQWKDWWMQGTHIDLVHLYQHLTWDGKFWLPKPDYLEDK